MKHSNLPTFQPSNPAPIRRTMYFSGLVQGVGFRYTAQALASGFRVAGFVRNLPDGRVQLVAEGPASELSRFQSAIGQAMGSYINEISATDTTATGEFTAFSIEL